MELHVAPFVFALLGMRVSAAIAVSTNKFSKSQLADHWAAAKTSTRARVESLVAKQSTAQCVQRSRPTRRPNGAPKKRPRWP
eukprot:4491225-Pyramimonas_sp.AAC.1